MTAAFYAIGCLDAPVPPTLGAVDQLAVRAARAAPYFGAATVWLGLPCTDVPRPPPPRARRPARGARRARGPVFWCCNRMAGPAVYVLAGPRRRHARSNPR